MIKKLFTIGSVIICFSFMNINNLSSQTFIRDICKDFNITRIEDSMVIDLKSDTTGVFYTFEKGNRYVQPFIYRLDECDSIKQKACFIIIKDVKVETTNFTSLCPFDTLLYAVGKEIYYRDKSVPVWIYFKMKK